MQKGLKSTFHLLSSCQKNCCLFISIFFWPGMLTKAITLPACESMKVKTVHFLPVCVWVCGIMSQSDRSLSVRRCFTFATGLVECLCFAGAVFGWASLVFVLKTEGYFSSLCVNTTGINSTQALGLFDLLASATSGCLFLCCEKYTTIFLKNFWKCLKNGEYFCAYCTTDPFDHTH